MSPDLVLFQPSDPRDDEIAALQEANQELSEALTATKREVATAKADAQRAVGELRRQLSPLYRALQAVFGEMETVGGSSVDGGAQGSVGPSGRDPRSDAVWASWKAKMGTAAKVIDALLLHGELNTQQLAIAVGLHRTTIPALIHKLNKAGLLNKNGGRFSLKTL